MNTQSPKIIGMPNAFDLNKLIQSDEIKNLTIEILLFVNHQFETKERTSLEKQKFRIEDFLNFSKRNKESLYSNSKLYRDLIISSNSRQLKIKNDFEYALIKIAKTTFPVHEVLKREGKTLYSFSSQSLLDFTIIVDKDENRTYSIHLNHNFLNSIAKEELFLETEKTISNRNL